MRSARARYRRYSEKRYYRLLSAGVCVKCGEEPADGVRCIYCKSKQALYDLCYVRF